VNKYKTDFRKDQERSRKIKKDQEGPRSKFRTFKGLVRLQDKYCDLKGVGQFRWHWKDQISWVSGSRWSDGQMVVEPAVQMVKVSCKGQIRVGKA